MIDPNGQDQLDEVKRIHRVSGLQIKIISQQIEHLGVEQSPQLEHFTHIHKGTEAEPRKIAACRGDE
ncbi:hypothetical protein [Dyella mobilis]|uniref:Uncharacterized protein n=1 Tax=Dyella mobilis TaxID=1849582 RepID=A0ABS2KBV7_9GAMM|nr:hypothetical protein [Dyella mobilis]MBM7128662.1 hypothetical protein [Dyella mobilis]GLQ98984.1 hypothetical protein GCM10007863_34040 [Dyella mobilis]